MSDPVNLPNGLDYDDNLAGLLGLYIDRINAGECVDQSIISSEHPEEASEIIAELHNLQLLRDAETVPDSLGTLGDYTLRRQIGRGGMGVVYEAWEGSMDRVVALKVLPAGVAPDDRAFQRFMQEAKTAGKLSHQNIVPVYSTGIKEGTPWFSMEFVEGETLAQIQAKIKDSEPETPTYFGKKDSLAYFSNLADAFADVADGLGHAHSKGVIHRDIKPSNLILDGEGRLRILDFGLARLEGQESLTLSGDFVGTPLYMSPEQARRKKIPVDHRTDVYSLGATIYEAVCGRPPFRGKDHADTLSQIIERDPVEPRKVNPRVPKDLETIVLKCLRKGAGDRYGTAEALAQDLRRFVRGDPIEARPWSSWQRLYSQLRRYRIALFRVSAVVTAGCVITWLGASVWMAQREEWREALKSQTDAHMDAGNWSAAIELCRELVKDDEQSAEAYLLLGTAVKHDLSGAQGSADNDSVLEFLTVAKRAWELAPEDPVARYLVRAARETATRGSPGAPTPGSSGSIRSALMKLNDLLPSRMGGARARHHVIKEDFADDPDLWNGTPLSWRVSWRSGEFEPTPDRDGLDMRPTGPGSCVVITEEVFSGNIRVGIRWALHGTRFGRFGLWIHGGPGPTGYMGGVRSNPEELGGAVVEIQKWRRGRVVRSESEGVSLMSGEDLQLELGCTPTGLECRVWHPDLGEERPATANVTMDDTDYRVGEVGFGGGIAEHAQSKGATLRIRSFSVIGMP